MSSQFKPIEIPPGVVAKATKKQASTNWSEVNLVRWNEGQMAPVGGQQKYAYTFASPCRMVHGWYDLAGVYYVAYLCEANLYVDIGGALFDITPTGGLVAPQPAAQGGYSDGNYNMGLQLKAASAILTTSPNITMPPNPGGVLPGMDVYDVTTGQDLGTVKTYVGTALVLNANALAAGASGDTINFAAYSQPRAIGSDVAIVRLPDAYSLDNFGAILLAMTSPDGRLLSWNPAGGGGVKAAAVAPKSGSTVPHGRCFVVTPERFVQIFGSTQDGTPSDGGSFRRFAWCNQEDFTDWSYADLTTQAGFIDIEPSSPIVAAMSTRTGTLFFTATKAYRARFLGLPYVYNYDELGDNCTPWSPQSMAKTSSMAVWMSQQGSYAYDGTSIQSVPCPVRPWVDDDVDLLNVRNFAFAAHVAPFNEIWWFFPQQFGNSGTKYPTRAIVYDYKEGWWSQARMKRTAGMTASYTSPTIMANGTVAYEHETLFTYNDADLPWAETFDLNIGSGTRLTTVKQLMPDIEGAVTNVLYSLFYSTSRNVMPDPSGATMPDPNGRVDTSGNPILVPVSVPVVEKQTTPRFVRPDGFVDFRTTGRDLRLRIDLAVPAGQLYGSVASDGSVQAVTVGQHLIDAVPRGDR